MYEKAVCSHLRREFSKSGWALLIYYGIMNAAVILVLMVDAVILAVQMTLAGQNSFETILEGIAASALSNGWGYILAMAVGGWIMLLWKKKEFCFHTVWKKEKPMTAGAFFSLAALFFSAQALVQVMATVMEWFFGLFGFSIMGMMESTSGDSDTLSMFLYASIFAPIGEEILFRGLILRSMQPYGKKFAILASAFLFGIFHGNMIQTPYAFMVGLVLGYVAVEYSIGWAMLLHMLNNMVLADFMTRLSEILPAGVGDLITLAFIWGCAIAAVIILIIRRRSVAAYIRTKRIHPWCMKSFFTSPGILVMTGIMAESILMTLLMQFLP